MTKLKKEQISVDLKDFMSQVGIPLTASAIDVHVTLHTAVVTYSLPDLGDPSPKTPKTPREQPVTHWKKARGSHASKVVEEKESDE